MKKPSKWYYAAIVALVLVAGAPLWECRQMDKKHAQYCAGSTACARCWDDYNRNGRR